MSRLNTERQQKLQLPRMEYAIDQLTGRDFEITHRDDVEIQFEYKGATIKYFPYSGWATGRTIKDGRGLENLLKQLI